MNATILDKLVKKSRVLANENKFRHFSFLLRKNKILNYSTNNMCKTHPLAYSANKIWPFIHSEIGVLASSDCSVREFKKCVLVNIRLGKRGDVLLSRPCNSCAKILVEFNIGEVIYSNQFGLFERMRY